jgi:hypothetical protein
MMIFLRLLGPKRSITTSQTSLGRTTRTLLSATALLLASVGLGLSAIAQNARFDLTGPKVEVRVTRAGMTLPIASVPNLQPGDRIWVHPDLPSTQSIHYLMVLVFLRGTTNPPPDNWFIRIEAWDKKVLAEGVEVTVPDEAQQAVLFLAPVTGGDFSTLRSAVQGRPGIFVRASQDLSLSGFEQARIEKYIASMHEVPPAELSDPKALQEHSNLIAGILALKPNGDCVKLPPDQQYTCLTQTGSQNLLDDGHGQSIVSAISTGPGSDFINAASATSLAGGGVYSAYVGAIVDLVRIMGSLHTARYQYIPAIAFPVDAALNLRLNTAPSFHNPKSVIVIGLPSIQTTSAPPLRPSDPKFVSCLARPGLTLPVEGAPLVFSTSFAHDLVLHINYPEGTSAAPNLPQDLPLVPDAYKGGLVLGAAPERKALPIAKVTLPTAAQPTGKNAPATNSPPPQPAPPPAELTGTIEGYWGFDTFKGPTMPLQRTPGHDWKVASHEPLIAGRDGHVLLTSTASACINTITLDPAPGKHQAETWKAADAPNTVDVALKLSDLPGNDPRTLQLAIHQFGIPDASTVSLTSYSEPAKLTGLEYHAGDASAVLAGSSLEQVKQVQLGSALFTPDTQGSAFAPHALHLILASSATPPKASPGEKLTAEVLLKDGRTLNLLVTVASARPSIQLISKALVQPEKTRAGIPLSLGSQDDLPLADTLMFAVRSTRPFPRDARLEVASPDGTLQASLNVQSATLIVEDPTTVLGKLEPLKAFGPSAFGPIRARAVASDGSASDWVPLATLVRLPTITAVNCPATTAITPPSASVGVPTPPASAQTQPPQAGTTPATSSNPQPPTATPAQATCTLTGSDLFLIDSVSADPAFASPTPVPAGFVQSSLQVPAPTASRLFFHLRDNSSSIDTVDLARQPSQP